MVFTFSSIAKKISAIFISSGCLFDLPLTSGYVQFSHLFDFELELILFEFKVTYRVVEVQLSKQHANDCTGKLK